MDLCVITLFQQFPDFSFFIFCSSHINTVRSESLTRCPWVASECWLDFGSVFFVRFFWYFVENQLAQKTIVDQPTTSVRKHLVLLIESKSLPSKNDINF